MYGFRVSRFEVLRVSESVLAGVVVVLLPHWVDAQLLWLSSQRCVEFLLLGGGQSVSALFPASGTVQKICTDALISTGLAKDPKPLNPKP